jgi:hypothetical protein
LSSMLAPNHAMTTFFQNGVDSHLCLISNTLPARLSILSPVKP